MKQSKKARKHNRSQVKSNRIPNWVWLLVATAVILAGAVFFIQQGNQNTPATALEISVEDALAKREAGAFILDVRQPNEWEELHIPGATLIPLEQLQARIGELPANQEIVVVCRSGNRSATGRDILKQAGFEQVSSMAGGMNQWNSAGYPIETGP